MSSMQGSALNAILPFVARSLEVDLPTIQWVVLVYLIVSTGLLLAFGRLGDMSGQRRLFLTGFVVFISGSVLCWLAPNIVWLISARIVQAVGSGMITSCSSPLITKRLPPSHRGRGLSAQIVMVYCGLTAGPGVGGILADTLGWRWVFLVNVPVGLLAAVITLVVIPKDEANPSETFRCGRRLDIHGWVGFPLSSFRRSQGRGMVPRRQCDPAGGFSSFRWRICLFGAETPGTDAGSQAFQEPFFLGCHHERHDPLHRIQHYGLPGPFLSRQRHGLWRHERRPPDHGHADDHDDVCSFQRMAF